MFEFLEAAFPWIIIGLFVAVSCVLINKWKNMVVMNLVEGVQMNEQVKEYIDKYPNEVIELFHKLRQIILECISDEPKEKLWAKQPSYYVGEAFVRLIGNVEFVEDRKMQEKIWKETDRKFFKKGIDDPKFRLIRFHTIEATFWIEGKFRTCKYK